MEKDKWKEDISKQVSIHTNDIEIIFSSISAIQQKIEFIADEQRNIEKEIKSIKNRLISYHREKEK